MGNRSSRHRVDSEIPSDDEFDRYGNPKLPPGLEHLMDAPSPGRTEGSHPLDFVSLKSVQALFRSARGMDVDLPADGLTAQPEKVGAGLLIVSPLLGGNGGNPEGKVEGGQGGSGGVQGDAQSFGKSQEGNSKKKEKKKRVGEKAGPKLQRMALLLKRAPTSGNGNTWGLPGGNSDPGETDLWETAMREAGEEMGDMTGSELHRLATVLTKRGKRDEKHYTVYVVEMPAWEEYTPVLNEEHTAWEWVGLEELLAGKGWGKKDRKLHPVVQIVLGEYGAFLKESLLG